jgi:hypothetical protein
LTIRVGRWICVGKCVVVEFLNLIPSAFIKGYKYLSFIVIEVISLDQMQQLVAGFRKKWGTPKAASFQVQITQLLARGHGFLPGFKKM